MATSGSPASSRAQRIGFLGPLGTFTEQALLTQPDLAEGELVPIASIGEVLVATEAGEVDLGFVPIENSIEGSVNATIDRSCSTTTCLIQREVVLDVQLSLLGPGRHRARRREAGRVDPRRDGAMP